MPSGDGTILLEDHRLIFKNFKGKEGPFNREGERNFAVVLDDDKLVKQLVEDGWNVKYLKPREGEEEDEQTAYLQVSVSYKNWPPRIFMITSRGRVPLGEDECEVLDYADIQDGRGDMILRPYHWEVSGKTGIKAYLQSLFVKINEDALELKYADVDEVQTRSGRTYE
jgi:hypothetical protein